MSTDGESNGREYRIHSILEPWLEKHGVSHPFELRSFGLEGFGLVAKQEIKKGDVMLSLPQEMLFNISKALNDPQIGPILLALRESDGTDGSDGSLDDEEILSVYLCWERRKGELSHWYPYIQSLPESYDTMPDVYRSDPALLSMIRPLRRKAIVESSFEDIFSSFINVRTYLYGKNPDLFPPDEVQRGPFDFTAFRWAYLVVSTRSCYYKKGDENCLVPFGDLLNHHPGSESECKFNHEKNEYQFIAFENYRPGDQVFITYGTYGNGDLWEYYGFVYEGNIISTLDLQPAIPSFIEQTEDITERWKLVCEHKMNCHWYVDQRGEPSYNMMGACQLLCGASIADVYDSCSPAGLVEDAKEMCHRILVDLKSQYEPIPFRRSELGNSMHVPGAYSLMVLYDEEARMLELGIDRIGRMEFGKLEIAKKSESQEAEESITDDEEEESGDGQSSGKNEVDSFDGAEMSRVSLLEKGTVLPEETLAHDVKGPGADVFPIRIVKSD